MNHAHVRYCRLLKHGPLTRYVKLRVAHAPGMPGKFSPAADFKGNRLLAIPACITARASRTCRDACRDRLPTVTGKTFPASPAHAHPQFYVSGKRPIKRTFKLKQLQICFIKLKRHVTTILRNCTTRPLNNADQLEQNTAMSKEEQYIIQFVILGLIFSLSMLGNINALGMYISGT